MCLDVTTVSCCCTNVYILHLNCCTYSGTEIVRAVVIPVVMPGCESWTIEKAECQSISAFQLCCWRKLLRVPWTARRSELSILKKINPEYLLEGLMLKLKLQYFGYLMQRVNSLEKTWCWERLKAGGERDDTGQDDWMASPAQWIYVWASSKRWWSLVWCSPWGRKELDVTEQLNSNIILVTVCEPVPSSGIKLQVANFLSMFVCWWTWIFKERKQWCKREWG